MAMYEVIYVNSSGKTTKWYVNSENQDERIWVESIITRAEKADDNLAIQVLETGAIEYTRKIS
jgi:hypothetical protein